MTYRKPGKRVCRQSSWAQPAFGGNQRFPKRVNLTIDVRGILDGLRDCRPEYLGVTLPATMNQSINTAGTKLELFRNGLITGRFFISHQAKKRLERLKKRGLSLSAVLCLQTFNGLAQERHCPTRIKNFLGSQRISRFFTISILASIEIERNEMNVSPSFDRFIPMVLASNIVLSRNHQKAPKFPPTRFDPIKR